MQFKVSIHCGQVNTFQLEEADAKADLLAKYKGLIDSYTASPDCGWQMIEFGDLLINPNLVTFVVVEEVQEMGAPQEAVTL